MLSRSWVDKKIWMRFCVYFDAPIILAKFAHPLSFEVTLIYRLIYSISDLP